MAVSETYEKGREVRRQLLGDAYVERVNQTAYNDPIMKKFIDVATETVFGALWTRPGLDLKTRTLICVVSDAATARTPELAIHLRMARRQGWSEDELIEVLLHLSGYVGGAADPRGDADGEGSVHRDEEGALTARAIRSGNADRPARRSKRGRAGTGPGERSTASWFATLPQGVWIVIGLARCSRARHQAASDVPAVHSAASASINRAKVHSDRDATARAPGARRRVAAPRS